MHNALNLTGQRFGRLIAISRAITPVGTRKGPAMWTARCDCGKSITTRAISLKSGNTTSCGCSRTKHGQARTGLYRLWSAMIARCERPTAKSYKDYGARGISVCPRWRGSFEAFAEDMGPRPSPSHTLDRIDPNRGYEPGNVRWATWVQQGRNKRSNRLLTVDGVTMTLTEWSERTGIGVTTIRERIRRGWSVSRAVTEPRTHGTTRGPAPG
jgi:hypothetical protein